MSETTKGSSTPADRGRDLLAFDFEPILEFLSPEGIESAYQSLDDLTANSKIAFAILGKSKPELIDASRNMLTGLWPVPGSEDTELGVFIGPEVGHGETKVYAGVQA